MTRHRTNPNLTLHYENSYLGLPVQVEKGPFVLEYLHRLHQTTYRAIDQYRRVFAFRLDLRLPSSQVPQFLTHENEIIERFTESLRAKIRHNRRVAAQENKWVHDTVVRYVWAREVGQLGRPHYHLAILLNGDAFCALGKYETGRDNMFNRLQEAWASALRLPLEAVQGLVEISRNPYYHIHRDDHQSIAEFFRRTSYLCKSATKVFGDGCHGFGASRI